MAGAKNVIDMRPGKGFTTSQSNEHLRVFSDKDRAKKAQWNYDPSREHLNFEIGKGGVVMKVNKMKSIPQRIAENLEARGIKDPNSLRQTPFRDRCGDEWYRQASRCSERRP